jgi:hypothetical protein
LLGTCSTCWAMLPAVFPLVIFWNRVVFYVQAGIDHNLPIYASHSSWDDRCELPCPSFSVEMGSHELLPRQAWNHDPPELSLPHSWGGKHIHPHQLLVEVGSHKLFAQAAFEPWSSHSSPPE